MKISTNERQILLIKYKNEGLKFKDIEKRINELEKFEDYVKFSKKYLKCQI